MLKSFLGAALVSLALTPTAFADQADAFFDDSVVREVRLTFANANWYDTLYNGHNSNPLDPYYPVKFESGGVVLENVGVRFKGNASFRRNGTKKSFKLDFNEYDDDVTFLGLKKLNLNNLDLQPDFLREKLFLDFVRKFIPAMRAVHTRVFVNGVYWGLYIAIEQPDKTMMQSRFGPNEDGNLFESGEGGADLSYLGPNPSSYTTRYELETNEEENDYSGLIEFLDILNNTAPASLPARLEPIADVENLLFGQAANNLFTNIDSYLGSGTEYYLYDRSDTGRFVHIHWDLNETFGTVGDGTPAVATPLSLDPFWLPATGGGGGPGGGFGGPRPLLSKLWAVDTYKRVYLRMLARMLREGFDTAAMTARVTELANRIRADVNADTKKAFTNTQFETALTAQVRSGNLTLYGLLEFVRAKSEYLRPVLNAAALPVDVRLNEVAPSGVAGVRDGAGDVDPWVEIHNLGPGPVSLSGFTLSDDAANPAKWALPAVTLADGAFLVVWLDGETAEGTDHASFRLPAAGGRLVLSASNGATAIDSFTVSALPAGQSHARKGLWGDSWSATGTPTAGAANIVTVPSSPTAGTGLLKINEIMADNDSTLADPDEPGAFEDWFEVYNPGSAVVDLGGMYLTDDATKPTKWRVPSGVSIPAGGHLVFFADEETSQGPRHADFKLSAGGELVALYQSDGSTLIDSVAFGAQTRDVSYGRYPDGGDGLSLMSPATPGSANRVATFTPVQTSWVPVVTRAAGAADSVWRTDVSVLNGSAAKATLELVFHGESGTRTQRTEVAAGAQTVLADVVGALSGSGSGALEVRADRAVTVSSRTYNQIAASAACSPNGTLGLDLPSGLVADGLAAGESAWLSPLVENARFRSNVALTNSGTSDAHADVTLHDAAGNVLATYGVDLAPGEWKQENRPFSARAGVSTLDRGYARVSVTAGVGVFAYATVIDNLSNDPTTVRARGIDAVAATGTGALRVNEIMADNDGTIADPDEPGVFEDWFEIYNPGTVAVDMGGMYLTDDPANPTKWQVPAGVSVPAHGYVVFWADEDAMQGSRHAGFKLSAGGESVSLFQSNGTTLVDRVTFGAQKTNVSYARLADGGALWRSVRSATPGSANVQTSWVPAATHAAGLAGSVWRTDVGVLNEGTAAADVELVLHTAAGPVSARNTVPAGAQAMFADLVGQMGVSGSGSLEVRSGQPLVVTSRTYNVLDAAAACTPGGTLGFDLPGTGAKDVLEEGETAVLTPLAESAAARTNIGLVNVSGAPARATVTLLDGGGAVLTTFTVDLAAGEWKQENRPFAARAGRSNLAHAYAKVEATSGGGVVAYASVIDNVTNDPSTVLMRKP